MTLAEVLENQSLEVVRDIIEEDMDRLSEIKFMVETFQNGVIGKHQKRYLGIVKRIIDNVKQFERLDNRYYLTTLARIVAISKGLNIRIQ